MSTVISKLSRYLPNTFQNRYILEERIDYFAEEDATCTIENDHVKKEQHKSPFERKYMLHAKIKALEEYVDHLEKLLNEYEAYIQLIEEKNKPKRRLSI